MKRFALAFGMVFFTGNLWAVWDVAIPAGTEAKSLGDDRIREFKTDIQTSLNHEGEFPGEDTSNPKFIYTPSSGTSADRPTGLTNTATGQLFINTSSSTIEQFDGISWKPVASLIPSGFKMLLVGQECPPGWTWDDSFSSATVRISTSLVNGADTGGSSDISTTTFTHGHTVVAHGHTVYSAFANDSGTIYASDGVPTGGSGTSGVVFQWGAVTVGSYNSESRPQVHYESANATPATDTKILSILKYLNVIVCTAP